MQRSIPFSNGLTRGKFRRGAYSTTASCGTRGRSSTGPPLSLRFRENFHDRFLVVDDRDLYLIGASLKDLGKKCFGFTKMDSAEIPGLKARL